MAVLSLAGAQFFGSDFDRQQPHESGPREVRSTDDVAPGKYGGYGHGGYGHGR